MAEPHSEQTALYGSTAASSEGADTYSHHTSHAVDVAAVPDETRSRSAGVWRIVPRVVGLVIVSGIAVLAVTGGGVGSHTSPDRSYSSSIGKTSTYSEEEGTYTEEKVAALADTSSSVSTTSLVKASSEYIDSITGTDWCIYKITATMRPGTDNAR